MKYEANNSEKNFTRILGETRRFCAISENLVRNCKKFKLEFSEWSKRTYTNASILKDNRVVFNIKGNSYQLIVKFNYVRQWAFIRFIELTL